MEIQEMFKKPIDRDIKGVIKVGQNDEDNQFQELNEYVVTSELLKHFREFFSNYRQTININTDDIGVWISGFFGSGKSHFLKILSYILDSNMEVKGRKPLDFFKDDEKINDPEVIASMEAATNVDTDVILFNIDSKSSTSSSDSSKLLDVFVKVFNEFLGYCAELPFVAEFEKNLSSNGQYEQFKEAFEEIEGRSWEDSRDDFYFITDSLVEAIVKIGYMSEEAAKNWVEKAEDNYSISIDKFAGEINDYCKSKGNNRHLIFLVDEVGQYIGDNTQLMLNLQSLTEDLGIKCKGNAWIIVTSQQNIDDIINVKDQDFSKIQGRFKTRLSLSSANVDEVIRMRILTKTPSAELELEEYYSEAAPIIKNLITFKDSAEMKKYANSKDFVSFYPFIPYQFNLLQAVLTSIREHGASGKHLAEGERSMLALFQESAIKIKNQDLGTLVPFDLFYDALEKFIDHSHRSVIIKAAKNDRLNDFDVRVLKVLFMIKYVKEINGNVENIATLMVSNVSDDKIDLKNDIDKSLKRLINETLIQKNGEIYSFLTNEEQDLNREIKNENVEIGEILDEASNFIFYKLIKDKKYKYSNRYNFSFNKIIDNRITGKQTSDIGIRIITPYYESDLDDGQMSLDGNAIQYHIKELSNDKNEVIFQLNSDLTLFDEIREIIQIRKYLNKNNSSIKAQLKSVKQTELQEKTDRYELLLEEALKNADIYIKGQKADIPYKNSNERVNDALKKLIEVVYNKLSYFNGFSPEKTDILNALTIDQINGFTDGPLRNAFDDLERHIKLKSDIHEKISLKDVINRFSSAPYGYVDYDIEWMIAKLFSSKKITLTKNSETINLKSFKANDILNFLTKTEFRDKILIEMKKEISSVKIKTVRDVYSELFDSSAPDNSDDLMDSFKELLEKMLNEISNDLREYDIVANYPGKEKLMESKELFKEIQATSNIDSFYKIVADEEDSILDLGEDIRPILNFFKSSQKDFFKDADDVYNEYLTNRNLLDSEKLTEIAEKIGFILSMNNPYSNIKDLPNLVEDFNQENKFILNSIKEPVRNDIIDIKNSTEYGENEFNQLLSKLDSSKSIPEIKAMTDEAINIKTKLEEKNKPKDVKEREPVDNGKKPIIKVKDLSLVKVMSKSFIDIKSEEDINNFVKELKNQLRKELDDNDEIKLKFW